MASLSSQTRVPHLHSKTQTIGPPSRSRIIWVSRRSVPQIGHFRSYRLFGFPIRLRLVEFMARSALKGLHSVYQPTVAYWCPTKGRDPGRGLARVPNQPEQHPSLSDRSAKLGKSIHKPGCQRSAFARTAVHRRIRQNTYEESQFRNSTWFYGVRYSGFNLSF